MHITQCTSPAFVIAQCKPKLHVGPIFLTQPTSDVTKPDPNQNWPSWLGKELLYFYFY